MNKQVYVALPSTGNKVYSLETWREKSEREYLARSHPGPSSREKELEEMLMRQVSGQELPSTNQPTQFNQPAFSYKKIRLKERELESLLFNQVANG